MNFDPNKVAEKIRLAGDDWADKDYAASLLEETKKVLYSKLFLESTEKTVAEREAWANSHPDLKQHIEQMTLARREANKARVKYKSAEEWVGLVRTLEATKRQEMKG